MPQTWLLMEGWYMEVKELAFTGIGRAISDLDCQDGELSVSHNIIRDNGSMRPIWVPKADEKLELQNGEQLMFVHKTSRYRNFIVGKRVKVQNNVWVFYSEGDLVFNIKVFIEYPAQSDIEVGVALLKDGESNVGFVTTIEKGFSGYYEAEIRGDYTYNGAVNLSVVEDDYCTYAVNVQTMESPDDESAAVETFDELPAFSYSLFYFTEDNDERIALSDKPIYYSVASIKSIGNTLIICGANGLEYALFKDNAYKYLGTKPPEAIIKFSLEAKQIEAKYSGSKKIEYSLIAENEDEDSSPIKEDMIDYCTEMEAGLRAEVEGDATDMNCILYPCFVRYAYRLYDGSHIMHSSPILLVPSTNVTPAFVFRKTYDKDDIAEVAIGAHIKGEIESLDLSDWSDIITSVDIFMSEQINPRNLDAKMEKVVRLSESDAGKSMTYGWLSDIGYDDAFGPKSFYDAMLVYYGLYETTNPLYTLAGDDMARTDYMSRIKETSNFYKVRTIDSENIPSESWYLFNFEQEESDENKGSNLSNLVLGERLKDDYQTNDTLIPSYMYSYNGRLNISGIERVLFDGYHPNAMIVDVANADFAIKTYRTIDTYIKKEGKTIIVRRESNGFMQFYPMYLFYPDVDAYKMVIYYSLEKKFDGSVERFYGAQEFNLEQHLTLNGAVWFNSFKEVGLLPQNVNPAILTDKTVDLPNKIYTSEINNPFYFPLSGINTVGVGEIAGIASVTKALSQGQFGQFPLYVFSSDGVWAMEVGSDGLYTSVKPISRDVCINAESITQTDNAVLFVSEKGVMLVDGSSVDCISGVMDGRSFDAGTVEMLGDVMTKEDVPDGLNGEHGFMDFVRACRMAYDYGNGRVVLFKDGEDFCYVYSLTGGTWATLGMVIGGAVNDYPDTYVQSGNDVIRLTERIDYDNKDEVSTLIVTRPLKMGDDGYKTVYEMVCRGAMDRRKGAVLLWGSHDGLSYTLIADAVGNRIYRTGGSGYRYYRIGVVGKMNVGETVSMCSLKIARKYGNRLR